MITPVITDTTSGRELWRAVDCAEHCGVNPVTWRSYSTKGLTPAPVTSLGNLSLWFADEVKQWHANRPGSNGQPPRR